MDARSQAIENQVQKHKSAIAKGLAATWSPNKVAQAWNDTAITSPLDRQQAASWVQTHIPFDSALLGTALASLWATGTVLGSDAAEHAFVRAGGEDEAVRISASYDWSNWTAGNRDTALLANPEGGLAARLDARGIMLKGIDTTTADRIGTVLSNGLAEGFTPAMLVDELTALNLDAKRAETIARTEMTRAVADEAMNRYEALGVMEAEWNTVSPCDECADNEGEIRPLGDDFPSGDMQPPVHPNCNCFLIPIIDDGSGDSNTSDTVDMGDLELSASASKGLKPGMKIKPTVGVPSSLEVTRGLSRLEILPNPNNPALEKPEKFVEPPWTIEPVPTVDPNIWDQATVQLVQFTDLFSTDPYLKRKNVKKHIVNMGQALTPFRSYAMVLEHEGKPIIIDGHHRLMALWLLGLSQAPVWYVKDTH